MLFICFVGGNIYAYLCPRHSIILFMSFVLNISLGKYCAEGFFKNNTERSRKFINTRFVGKLVLLIALDIHSRSLKMFCTILHRIASGNAFIFKHIDRRTPQPRLLLLLGLFSRAPDAA